MSKTYDEMVVVDVLLNKGALPEKQRALSALAAQAAAHLENRVDCPECGDSGPHDDNGMSGSELTYCCTSCGAHFDACEV